jgi:hypothetical protein
MTADNATSRNESLAIVAAGRICLPRLSGSCLDWPESRGQGPFPPPWGGHGYRLGPQNQPATACTARLHFGRGRGRIGVIPPCVPPQREERSDAQIAI